MTEDKRRDRVRDDATEAHDYIVDIFATWIIAPPLVTGDAIEEARKKAPPLSKQKASDLIVGQMDYQIKAPTSTPCKSKNCLNQLQRCPSGKTPKQNLRNRKRQIRNSPNSTQNFRALNLMKACVHHADRETTAPTISQNSIWPIRDTACPLLHAIE
jgi:hypothetical protein